MVGWAVPGADVVAVDRRAWPWQAAHPFAVRVEELAAGIHVCGSWCEWPPGLGLVEFGEGWPAAVLVACDVPLDEVEDGDGAWAVVLEAFPRRGVQEFVQLIVTKRDGQQ